MGSGSEWQSMLLIEGNYALRPEGVFSCGGFDSASGGSCTKFSPKSRGFLVPTKLLHLYPRCATVPTECTHAEMAPTTYKLRVDTEQQQRWQKAADAAGVKLAEWMRQGLDEFAAGAAESWITPAMRASVDAKMKKLFPENEYAGGHGENLRGTGGDGVDQRGTAVLARPANDIIGATQTRSSLPTLATATTDHRENLHAATPESSKRGQVSFAVHAPSKDKSPHRRIHGITKGGRCSKCP